MISKPTTHRAPPHLARATKRWWKSTVADAAGRRTACPYRLVSVPNPQILGGGGNVWPLAVYDLAIAARRTVPPEMPDRAGPCWVAQRGDRSVGPAGRSGETRYGNPNQPPPDKARRFGMYRRRLASPNGVKDFYTLVGCALRAA
jgi:hypothetical protein